LDYEVRQNKNKLLCILDGFGVGENNEENAIYMAKTPTLDMLNSHYPHSELRSDGNFVGIPEGQMGNSEVGHITIGTGRVIEQSLVKITNDIENNNFQSKTAYKNFVKQSTNSRAIHLIGLLSDGGIHSHINHAISLCKLLNELDVAIFVHAITDGRDTSVNAAKDQINEFQTQIKQLKNVSIVTVIGRFYAMDRDNRWDRTKIAWDLYTKSIGTQFSSVQEAFSAAYSKDLSDEHIKPSKILTDSKIETTIQDNDSVFLFNFRGDRMRQLTRCLLNLVDSEFDFVTPSLSSVAIMTEYDIQFRNKCNIIYQPKVCKNSLGEIVSKAGLKQLRIAETEKYAHVTFFFNNGREKPFSQEDRILIPSPRDVATYDLKPQMSLPELTEQLVKIIQSNKYDLIVLNIANADMVGHTGNFKAAVKAVEYINSALKEILSTLKEVNGEALIIADHGNIEKMSVNDSPSTTHTSNPVPCIYYGKRKDKLRNGSLRDVAPTLLDMLNLEVPKEMTGKSLFID
jgi:2,3-bisphosphoglycerate-independent phosphoglycerate mutase